MYPQVVLVILLLLTDRGTTQSTSTAATTTILPVRTMLPAGSRVAGSFPEIASPNSQSLLCDGFECGENEFCSRANSPVFFPRCRPCSTVQHNCGDMGNITRNYRGCEAFCLNSQREELVTNCTREKKMLSDDLSSSAAGELATTKTQLKDAEATIADLKRQIQELGLEKRNLENKSLDLESKRRALETSVKEAKDKTVVLMVVVSFLVAFIVVVALGIICFRWLASKWRKGGPNSSILTSFQKLLCDNEDFQTTSRQSVVSNPDHQGDPEAPVWSPDSTFLKPSAGNGPVEAHWNPGDSRNLVAPTGDRTERVPGDENDFCQTLQNTNSSDDVSGNTDVDPMTSSARNVNVTNVGTPPVSETAGPNSQWSAFTSSSDEARSEILQPLLKSHSRAGVKQPVEGKEHHNSKYKFGSNTSLQKE